MYSTFYKVYQLLQMPFKSRPSDLSSAWRTSHELWSSPS
jgi:hypothetical protein